MYSKEAVFENWHWNAPEHWLQISTIDTHTGGMPLRIVTGGLPEIKGGTLLEKRRYFMENFDSIRSGLLREPRGHADMYGAILLPPAAGADLDVFFLNTVGYSPMCGHAILAIAKVAIETGLIHKADMSEIAIDVPPGRTIARADQENGAVTRSYFRNVPSFVYLQNESVEIKELGPIRFDIAFGGAFYAIVDAAQVGLGLQADSYNRAIELGRRIKQAINNTLQVRHPYEADLSSLFGVIFTGPALDPSHHSRNIVVYEDGEVDRSATGTGVSARAALLAARGELELNRTIEIESILGSTMTVRIAQKTRFGDYDAVIPEVGGTAYIMGQNRFYFDPADPFPEGFMFR